MTTIAKLLKIKPVAEAPVTDEVPAVPATPDGNDDDRALEAADKRLAEARQRLEELRAKAVDLKERGGVLSDQRAMLLRELAAGGDVQDEVAEVESALGKVRGLSEGTTLLLETVAIEEREAVESERDAALPVIARRRAEALSQAVAAADTAAARFYDLYAQTAISISDLEDAVDHLGAAGGDPSNFGRELQAYGRDPLTKLMQSGWKPRDTRTAYLPRQWVISALIPLPERPPAE